MNVWQLGMAIALLISLSIALVTWLRVRRALGPVVPAYLAPWQRRFVTHGYLVAALPLGEAWTLWMGGFW